MTWLLVSEVLLGCSKLEDLYPDWCCIHHATTQSTPHWKEFGEEDSELQQEVLGEAFVQVCTLLMECVYHSNIEPMELAYLTLQPIYSSVQRSIQLTSCIYIPK